jgi:hypothetical protein
MTPRVRRLVAVVTLILALAVVAVLTLRAFGVPLALGPSSPTPVPSLSATPGPSGSASPSLEEAVAALEADAADIRDLPPADISPAEFISREELEQRLADAFAEQYSEEEIAAENALYHALGLLAPDQDIAALRLQLLSSQVIGYYDDSTQTMVVVADAGLTPETEVVYVHEYVHALQDAAFGMDSLDLEAVGDDDGAFARLSLLEGDATTAMVLWAYDNLTAQEILGISQTPLPDTTGVPAWMVRQLGFPYLEGTEFAAQLYQRGGFAGVDAAWADPPRSTEQVIHFEAYVEDEEPVLIDPIDVTALDVDVVLVSTFGEAMIGIWLAALGVDQGDAEVAGAGWGGDALSVVVSTDGTQEGVVLRIAFDTPVDADEFVSAYQVAVGRLDVSGVMQQLNDTLVIVRQGTSEAFLLSLDAQR